ncbi:MAG TPA: DUF1572 family protein [Candidatus Hydrogenedentes bacterium]|nr:DUF1572 family protein [Candidatus Hydrogenedentota bacterium]HIJ74458.1 DUF1572 family protein [Candidatus Hydrogenedentota bacterium]
MIARSEFAELANAFLEETKAAIAQEYRRIQHCFEQLTDEQIWLRPAPHVNAIGTIVRHLCGNMRQWFLHGVGGEEDVRCRPAEFADAAPIPRKELLEQFADLLRDIYDTLDAFDGSRLLEGRQIQGSDTNVLSAIYSTVTHLEGHAQQIVYITHLYLGEKYLPFWRPESAAQGA